MHSGSSNYWNLELLVFEDRGKPENPAARTRTTNKLNHHVAPGIKPGSHWWEASALTPAPSLSPTLSLKFLGFLSCSIECNLALFLIQWSLLSVYEQKCLVSFVVSKLLQQCFTGEFKFMRKGLPNFSKGQQINRGNITGQLRQKKNPDPTMT